MPRGAAGSHNYQQAQTHTDQKPKGRTTAYAFFIQTCREEHKRKHPNDKVVFGEFARKCADSWKVSKFLIYYRNVTEMGGSPCPLRMDKPWISCVLRPFLSPQSSYH